VAAQRRLLTANVEYAVKVGADDLAARVAAGPVSGTLTGVQGGTAQVVAPDGRVLAASADLGGRPPIGRPPPAGRRQSLRSVPSLPGSNDPYRVLSRRVDGRDGPLLRYVAGAPDDVDESTGVLATTLTVAIPALTAG